MKKGWADPPFRFDEMRSLLLNVPADRHAADGVDQQQFFVGVDGVGVEVDCGESAGLEDYRSDAVRGLGVGSGDSDSGGDRAFGADIRRAGDISLAV